MKQLAILVCAVPLLLLAGCTGVPDGVQPVSNFDINRYLGKWYEIARLDHSFERGLEQVTARYSLRDDGGVNVLNRGFETSSGEWRQAEGRAYFVNGMDVAHLKVSFFGPFYGAYVVFELDRQNYDYAFVAGPSKSYLWLLSRTPEVSEALLEKFRTRARTLGFAVDELILVSQ